VGHPVFAAADGEENSRTNAMCPSPRKKNTCQATAQHKQPKIPGLRHFRNIQTNIGVYYSIALTPAKVPKVGLPRTAEPTALGALFIDISRGDPGEANQ